jgi:membrane protein
LLLARLLPTLPRVINKTPSALDAVFLDIDGTLVDSNEYHVKAWEQALRVAGLAVPAMLIRKEIGKGADQLIPALAPDLPAADRQPISDAHDEIFRTEYLPRVRPYPDATELVTEFHDAGIRVVLASSAKQKEVDHYVQLLGIDGLLAATTSADDVKRSKPAGDIFAAALKKVSPIARDRTLAIGDTPYDAISAGACDVRCVGVLTGGFSSVELLGAGMLEIYPSVSELLNEWRSGNRMLGSNR